MPPQASLTAPPATTAPPPVEEEVRRPWLAWGTLLLITAVGTALRFYKLDHPALWGDEVATWRRITGTFEFLMTRLSRDGFVPGHYVSYWLLGQYVPLTPWFMRLIPAVAGSLMAPAGYFLARQMLSRKVSLVAALLLATSAFAMTYARDAKMYMHTWLFLTLSVACLLHWLRTKRVWSWGGWVLAGAIASTLHVTSLIVLVIQPIMLLTHGARKRKRDPAYFVLGVALILAFPTWYYKVYNTFIARSGIAPVTTAADDEVDPESVNWRNSGISWVQRFNEGIGPWELTLNSASSYLVGLQWPRAAMDPGGFKKDGVPPWFLPLCTAVMTPLVLLLAVGALPWRHRPRDGASDAPHQAWWVTTMWLGLWLVVPTYGVYYCRSFPAFRGPWEPLVVAHHAIGGHWYLLVPLIVGVAAMLTQVPRAAPWLAGALAAGVATSIATAIHRRGSFWLHGWGELLGHWWVLWPIAAVAPAVLWHYAGVNTRERLTTTGRLLLAGGVVFAACLVAYGIMCYAYAQHQAKGLAWQSIWMPRYLGLVYPAVILTVAALLMRLPTWPLRGAAIAALVAVNLTQGLARLEVDTEPPWPNVAADLWATRTAGPTALVAINLKHSGAHQGNWPRGGIQDYYLYTVSGWDASPDLGRKVHPRRVTRYRVDIDPAEVGRELAIEARLRRIILWERFDALTTPPDADPLLDRFGDTIARVDERVYRTHQFWTWRPGNVYRRREYARAAGAVPHAAETQGRPRR